MELSPCSEGGQGEGEAANCPPTGFLLSYQLGQGHINMLSSIVYFLTAVGRLKRSSV